MKKKVMWIIGLVVLVVVIAAGLFVIISKTKKPTVSYETIQLSRTSLSNSVTATGTIEPVTEVEVGTQVSGIIDKIYVDYNSEVHEGQLIAEMDKVTLESELASAQASYEGCQAEYVYRKKNYERSKSLYDQALISDLEYEQALYDYKMAESSLHNSQATLSKAQRNLSYATITSPIDGVVIDRAVEEGQTVAAGFETPTLFTIAADLTQMQVVADVDEADIGGVREGQRVVFTVDAYPNDEFEGVVKQIRLGSSTSSSSTTTTSESVVTYEVVITADNPELKLKPRLTANIFIYTLEKNDVLCVPSKALRFDPEGPLLEKGLTVKDCDAAHKLWIQSGNQLIAYPVEIGMSNGIMTEIVSGLKEGDEVILGANFVSAKSSAASTQESSERSPFMPGPPESKSKK